MHELTDYTGTKHTLKQGTGRMGPFDNCDACSLKMMCGGMDTKCDTRTGSYYTSAPTAQPLHGDVASGTF